MSSGQPLEIEPGLLAEMIDTVAKEFEGDPAHKCMGHSTPARLQRALQLADEFNLDLPALRNIAVSQ